MQIDVRDIADWLIDGARSSPDATDKMSELCERLIAAGISLWRVGFFVRTLHPEIYGRNFIWRLGGGVAIGSVDFDIRAAPEFVASPLAIVILQGREVRCRAEDPESRRFPILEDLRAEGVTDYVAFPFRFVDGSIHASSWTTRQEGGFTEEQLAALRSILSPLTRVVEIISFRQVAVTLLDTYVGNRAGARILGGQIRRGHTESMNAAIWLSDLRGFTTLSDRLPPETMVDILNSYFDCQVAAIQAHGGEVLKYMGDGLLAVFPIDEYVGDATQVCSRVLEAAREASASVDALEYQVGDAVERFRFAVALHVGPILYGNIGGGNRLDFTCIGPAVNLAARLEKIAARLGRTVVASEGFASICRGGWVDLGEFPIAGFSQEQRVFGLIEEAATEATREPEQAGSER